MWQMMYGYGAQDVSPWMMGGSFFFGIIWLIISIEVIIVLWLLINKLKK